MGITKVYAMFTDGSNILVQEQYNYQAVVKGKSDDKYRVHSLPGGGVERGLNYNQSMIKKLMKKWELNKCKFLNFKIFKLIMINL